MFYHFGPPPDLSLPTHLPGLLAGGLMGGQGRPMGPPKQTTRKPWIPVRASSYCLLGASDDTGNLGVSALAYATLASISEIAPTLAPTVFDHGWGVRDGHLDGEPSVSFRKIGLRRSRRFHRRESYWNTRWSARLGGLGNPAAIALREAGAVFDISGGDSFTDLYGPERFAKVAEPKELALELGRPLILLPQTYGPFTSPDSIERARAIVNGASQAWARDEDSYAALLDLAGPRAESERLRLGVDVAFALPCADESVLDPELQSWLDEDEPVAGFNVSGLVLSDTDTRRFGLSYDYRRVVIELVERLSEEARIMLIPHVMGDGSSVDLDPPALVEIHGSLPPPIRERVRIAPEFDDPRVVKALIARCSWFCGTRMHATIASLSSGIPSAALAYSPKTRGVFATCDQAQWVVTTSDSTEDAIERIWTSWQQRDRLREQLGLTIPQVVERSRDQFSDMLAAVPGLGEGS